MRRIRSLPVQVRITLGSVLIAGIVLLGVAILMAYQIRSTTTASETSLARSDLTPYIADLQNNKGEKPDKPASGILVAIRDEANSFLVNTLPRQLQRNLDDRDLHDRQFARVPRFMQDSEAPTKRVTSGGTTYLVVERHITVDGEQFTLWAARSTASGDLTIRSLDRSLAIGLVLAFLAFGGAAYLLSTLSLRPVKRMARSAELLSREGGDGVLPVSTGGDELSALATTLNVFIGRLRAAADHERQIVSDASHELRTPIAALTARLELAHRSFGDAAALEREIRAAEVSVARLSELTTTLLELSRLDEAVGVDPETSQATALELRAELLQAVDRARIGPGAASVDIDFDVEHLDRPDARYALSASSFGRIADNLIGNAVTFSPDGGTVQAVLSQNREGSLVLEVTDEGPGLPDDFVPHAFDRFSRADEARRRIRGGNGLGLALVRGLSERAGGDASIANRLGGGAKARVEVPQM
jgi:two-component system OmpR family sensor kinase